MRKGFILLLLAAGNIMYAQSLPPGTSMRSDTLAVSIPSDEAFINQVFHTVVDSSFERYYLCVQAGPCSFVKYDYDEWIKYDLRETVPIYTLNELAKNAYFDRKTCDWQQDRLAQAVCISREKADSALDPVLAWRADSAAGSRRQRRAIARGRKAWASQPAAERTVFYFSRPAFTDDGQYAILDMDFRCDDRQCGEGATCLFHREGAGWKLIGRRIRWGQ
jgi:hypothetical protein